MQMIMITTNDEKYEYECKIKICTKIMITEMFIWYA